MWPSCKIYSATVTCMGQALEKKRIYPQEGWEISPPGKREPNVKKVFGLFGNSRLVLCLGQGLYDRCRDDTKRSLVCQCG